MSEKVRTRLEELDDFEEVRRPLMGYSEEGALQPFCQGWLLTVLGLLGPCLSSQFGKMLRPNAHLVGTASSESSPLCDVGAILL